MIDVSLTLWKGTTHFWDFEKPGGFFLPKNGAAGWKFDPGKAPEFFFSPKDTFAVEWRVKPEPSDNPAPSGKPLNPNHPRTSPGTTPNSFEKTRVK